MTPPFDAQYARRPRPAGAAPVRRHVHDPAPAGLGHRRGAGPDARERPGQVRVDDAPELAGVDVLDRAHHHVGRVATSTLDRPQVARHVLDHAVHGGGVRDVGLAPSSPGRVWPGRWFRATAKPRASSTSAVARADAGGRSGHERHPHTTAPELGETTSPVRYDAASDARNAMSRRSRRASRAAARGSDSRYSGVRHMSVRRAVSVAPGATELTRTPRGRELERERLREADDGALGGAVVGVELGAAQGELGAHVHDRAAAPRGHPRPDRAAGVPGAAEVHAQHPVPLLVGDVARSASRLMWPAQFTSTSIGPRSASVRATSSAIAVRVGDVERQVGADDVHPGRLERVGGGAADAAARAGDERDGPTQWGSPRSACRCRRRGCG